ncbi:unnamed protein product [Ceratitis capitata]|uniref:(Mediterranean fruit fly) hypothetical protein n=1 Tax=Ceratitis capitata TaxID=7213 RepID=A0A811U426_CERCA|nr:unnamed protein product [Ceratitis capitata]
MPNVVEQQSQQQQQQQALSEKRIFADSSIIDFPQQQQAWHEYQCELQLEQQQQQHLSQVPPPSAFCKHWLQQQQLQMQHEEE